MSEKTSRSPLVGLFVLIGKVGGKIAKVFPQLLKALKLGKTGMATGSFAAYAVLFSWEFALVLMGSLFVHEMGHIWAMRKSGMRTKGVYFIPLLGAAAVGEGDFPTRKSEVFIALMGPLWGFGLAVLTFVGYLLTGHVLFAALAGWMAMVNMFNLLPINPLDGGRVMKSVAYSISNRAGLWFLLLGLAGAFALAWVFNLGLITLLIILGTLELLSEVRAMRRDDDRRKIVTALAETLGCANDAKAVDARIAQTFAAIAAGEDAVDLRLPMPAVAYDPGDDEGTRTQRDKIAIQIAALQRDDAKTEEMRRADAALDAEFAALVRDGLLPGGEELIRRHEDSFAALRRRQTRQKRFEVLLNATAANAVRARRGLIRFWRKECAHEPRFLYAYGHMFAKDDSGGLRRVLLDLEPKPIMTPRETFLGFGAYLALGLALFGLMYAVAHVPAAEIALRVFVG